MARPADANAWWDQNVVQGVAMLRVRRLFSTHGTSSLRRALWIAAVLATAAFAGQALAQPADAPGGLHSGFILLLGIMVLALLLVLPKLAFRMVGRAVVALVRPLARVIRAAMKPIARVLRVLRLLPREPRPLAAPSMAALTTGAIGRAFAGGSETEEAIAKGVEPRELEGMLQRNSQLLCSWLAPVPHPRAAYDAKAAEADRENVRRFFSTPVPIYLNPFNLYEDADSAFIVDLFRDSDRRIFYVLSEFRKTINRNVLWLAVLFSMIVSIVALANILLSTSIDFHWLFRIEDSKYFPTGFQLFGSELETKPVLNKFVFGALSCLIGYAIMWLFYHTEYAQFQRNNGQQMSNFLQFYLDSISIYFSQISANAVETVAQEREAAEMKHDTVLWMTSLQWMAFRVFFIECYLRNVLFQIHRNSSYYVLLVPIAFIAAMLTVAYLFGIHQLNILSLEAELYRQNSFYVFFLVLLFASYGYLRDSLSFIWQSLFPETHGATDARFGRWTKFRDLNMQGSITRTLDAYVDSLDRWRSMMKSRG
jgi:hypothetical protein